ncbi:MAG TPA: hypothetical protein VFV38_50565 [Ktedonobacteraceae bacterium]|nr:hypothetical protein [Ktedonobacteraceae bacterium]
MKETTNQSEIAHLLDQIELEYLAARRGLTGLAETTRHAFITARMERMGKLHENLQEIIGEDATRLLYERIATIPDEERKT